MHRLWKYEKYVDLLSHENRLVRRWAFDAIEKQYPNKYTDAVSRLISDEDEHLACAAPKYLAKHKAVQHAAAILESFRKGKGNIPSNCALALSKMRYEPALEEIVESLSNSISADSLYGIFNYLGSVHHEIGRETLTDAALQIKDPLLQGNAFFNLLRHNQPEDIILILGIVLKPAKGKGIEVFLIEAIADFWKAGGYFNDFSKYQGGKSILDNPKEVLNNVLKRNSHILVQSDELDKLIKLFEKKQYHDIVTTLMFAVQNIIKHRYPENKTIEDSQELFDKDSMAVILFKELSKQTSVWKKLKASKDSGIEYLIFLVLSVYFSILERDSYLKALSPDSQTEDLISA